MSPLLRHRLRAAAVFCALGLVAGACAGETSTVAVGSNDGATTSPTTGTNGAPASSAPANTSSPETPAGPAATDAATPDPATPDPATPDPAIDYPSFGAITSTGEAFELSDHAGEDVLLWFWAPW